MQLTGKLSAQEVKDVGRLVRSKWYWPRLLISNLYGVILIGAALWFVFISGDREHWKARSGVFLIIVVIFGWAAFSSLRERRKELVAMNAGLPDIVRVDSSGLHTQSAKGAQSSRPWDNFKGWRLAKSVILLDLVEVKGFVMLPLTNLSSAERELLEGTITSHLGDRTSK